MRLQTVLSVLSTDPSLPTIQGQHVLDLSEIGWTVSSTALNRIVPGHLPSQVHLDLYAAGVIGRYYGLNDFNLRWIADANWTYTSEPLRDLQKDAKSSWLVFNGLDTFATVDFCGQTVGTADNQFRQWIFDVSQILEDCRSDPVLSINFGSAPNIVNAIANDPSSEVWPARIQEAQVFEYPNRWFMRKEQSDFGWDWGPAFAPAGPWQPAYIVQLENEQAIYITNTDLDTYRKGQINHLPPDQSQPWVVNASIDFIGEVPSDALMSVLVSDAKTGEILITGDMFDVTISDGSITGHTVIGAHVPKLWWPNGLGDQNLYNFAISISTKESQTLASITKRTGFRTIFLNRLNITEDQIALGIAPGANWHFEVNGHEFYAKGSNIIPPDTFWPRVTETKMRRLLKAVVAGNQNMLRVWASGAYLPDFIYDIADEEGIFLWSEFQFGDALYPVDKAFLENVAAEVTYNVRRVNHHPSLALWAGGNEIESLMLPAVKAADPTAFVSLILPLVYENTRSISYMPSSTNNGYLGVNLSSPVPMAERYWNITPGKYYGDTDHYNYDSSVAFDTSSYPVGRFANEFGYHSMPSVQTWQQALDPQDLYFNSSVVMLRNHHYPMGGLSTDNLSKSALGMGEMTRSVERYYPLPRHSDRIANFSAWCHATQIFQADFYKSQIQFYRRGSGMPERQLGALYWQLEDIWQAPSWAGIEYDGRWKTLHYVAKDIYRPIIVSPFWNHNTSVLEIYATSDLWKPAAGTVRMTWLDMAGKPLPGNAGTPSVVDFQVGAINTTRIYSTHFADLSLSNLTNSILILSLTATAERTESTFSHENYFTPSFPKDLALRDPHLELSYSKDTGKFTVKATSGVSLYTWIDYPAGIIGYFEENSFVLLPGESREVGFVMQENPSGEDSWIKGVTVQSLWDQGN
ncbi:hypothetical protein ASPZODRAFT_153009 [Penicilliopsis zonata CBS 506.65]|uniref:Beta-mannosidase A n=1 Tax=Penicilliopsis zonata CBS 506.65 TaxID=1073090 RepID=A0A1L9SDS1_9EURO|nr:hypothetical protein ASPZODRAFT_153009 [Penicilliopsis zonata CBS 506.65]OJJ45346.1 hypothetical protein ASPZODRAFT_153009 [Penicilliopsis zonata CBS 506.65]